MADDQAAATATSARKWPDRIAWAAVALLTGFVLQASFQHPMGWPVASGLIALLCLSAVRPYEALLVLSALGPLSTILFLAAESPAQGFRLLEAMTLAFLTGFAASRVVQPRPASIAPALRWSATLLAAAALASAVVSGAVLRAEQSGEDFAGVVRDYAITWHTLSSGLLMFEGVLLLLAVAHICAADPRRRNAVLRMMVVGAAAAAVFNLLRIVMVAVQREQPWSAFISYFGTLRVNVHHTDLNAAGSYFAMALLMAFGLRRRQRGTAAVCIVLIAAALWVSGSRTALAAVCLIAALAAGVVLRQKFSNRLVPVLAGAALLVVVAAAGWAWYPQGRNLEAGSALDYRVDMARIAFRLTASEPIFGVGLGWFPLLSGNRENAHNNFLQVLAELGIPGLLLFVSTIAFALREAVRSPARPLALLAGITAFLLTSLGGHPLLVPGAAYPFWIALGLAAAPQHMLPPPSRRWTAAGVVLLVAIVAVLPWRIDAAVRQANVGNQTTGLSQWQAEPDGPRYRWAGGQSSFFVDASLRAVRIPLRHGSASVGPLEVRIFLDGREANRVILEPGGDWQTVPIVLSRNEQRAFSRIHLEAGLPGTLAPLDVASTETSGLLMVGRPIANP